MAFAVLYSSRSSCLYYHVGTVISRDKHMLSGGYNGAVAGDENCCDVGCAKERDGKRLPPGSAFCRGAHAEMNAMNFAKCDLTGATIYTTIRPCLDCAKQIIQQGIKRVIYLEDYDGDQMAIDILRKNGVQLIPFSDISETTFGDFRVAY
ncbi:MAG: dCMP deaminase family protein, partial [Candidatus Colwellbacteria bacterium]|nr:dCMP deaminase family protein [Candidatus Colwellbacteria bacterium]